MKELEQIAIGRYHIQGHLARGGMADIYLAHDSESGQTVAIKMVHESAGEYCERFRHEVAEMAALTHEHILPAFDYGEYQSWYFLVTPYIEYGTLNGRLTSGPLTLEEADMILVQLAKALQFAHEQGIVHRDIKPSNILMRDGHHVYLADFGLVKRVGEESGLTVTGYLIGTPEYMAPELAEEDATPLSDVYALGVLLYQMLAGRVPFKANTPMGVFLRHIRDVPKPPTFYNSSIPDEVEEVILRALEKSPEKRYQSAQQFYQAYQQAVENVATRKEALSDQQTQTNRNQVAVAIKEIKGPRKKGKNRRPLLFAITAVAALFIALFVLAGPALSPDGRGSNSHTADAHDARNTRLASPTSNPGHASSGSLMDSAAHQRSTTGTPQSVDMNPTHTASTTVLNQDSSSSTPQNVNVVNAPTNDGSDTNASGSDSKGSGSGTSNGAQNGNSGSGQSEGNNGSSGSSAGSGGGGTGSAGGTNSGSTGNSGSGQTAGNGGGQSAGSGGDQGTSGGGDQGNNGNGNGGDNGNGNGNKGGNGKGNGNGGGNGNGNGNKGGNGKGNGGGNGNGNGQGEGNGNGNKGGNGKGHGKGNGGD